MLTDLKVTDFLDILASATAVPGGGSIAALSGAAAASLSQMAAGLTYKKKGYEACETQMQAVISKTSDIKKKIVENINLDALAYENVMKAYKMSDKSDNEKIKRKNAIQNALEKAASVPMKVAEDSFDILKLTETIVKKCNKNVIPDVAVACIMARSAVLAALINVGANLELINDKKFINDMNIRVNKIENRARSIEEKILVLLKK